jgi:uncharacterized protein YfiM (DUF2279 family)
MKSRIGLEKNEKRTSNSQAFQEFCTLVANGMGSGMDQAEKRRRNSQAFLDFCTLVANGIGWVGEYIKLRKGRAILKLFWTFALWLTRCVYTF